MADSPLLGKRVVIVGAIIVVDVTLAAELRHAGAHIVGQCESPIECIEVVNSEAPDLLLLAATQGNLADVTEAIRVLGTGPAACVVVLSYHVDIEAERRLRELGIAGLFRTPFTAKDLIPALEETFRQHCTLGRSP